MWLEELIAESERTKTQLAELEVSLQALKEENAMLRDGIREERAAVVAWLRHGRWVEKSVHMRHEYDTPVSSAIHDAADIIERGEHRREEKP